jgi:hypothetical protein
MSEKTAWTIKNGSGQKERKMRANERGGLVVATTVRWPWNSGKVASISSSSFARAAIFSIAGWRPVGWICRPVLPRVLLFRRSDSRPFRDDDGSVPLLPQCPSSAMWVTTRTKQWQRCIGQWRHLMADAKRTRANRAQVIVGCCGYRVAARQSYRDSSFCSVAGMHVVVTS